ncbi:MAG TPA: monomeric [FeFe] hydrogenase [Spirochaetota bacterium]|nr:monomeric [FeFe] hydrogenase [Spirochaetota bacterium]
MFAENKTIYLRREIITRIAKLLFEDKLAEEIDKLPMQMIKKEDKPIRCCIYKDRELIKYRTIASLGFSLENEYEIDNNLLSDYAKIALKRDNPTFPILTFIDEACKACVRTNYFVTNVCRNCVDKPCMGNCPKNAIEISEDINQAKIIPEKCINCGICMKVCPFHSIVYVPVPCEESCPVGAISKDAQGKEDIDYSKCIFCGKCRSACPFGAIMEKSQIIDVISHIKSKNKTVAMIAPSIIGQFPGDIKNIVYGLKKVGFDYVVEVALGADITAKVESEEFVERITKGDNLMGTSCCPAYIESVKKHSKAFLPFVSHAKTPMAYTAEIVREKYPDCITVFIGPCIAKKHEGINNDKIDYVLTFEEIESMFKAKDIDFSIWENSTNNLKEELDIKEATKIGREFPVTSGVSNAVKDSLSNLNSKIELKPVLVNGLNKQNVKLLNIYGSGNCPGNLVEVMSCEGGCIAGPGVITKPQNSRKKLEEFLVS